MESATHDPNARATPGRSIATLRGAAPLAAWVGLIAVTWAWGESLIESTGGIGLGAPPLFGAWDLRLDAAVALPVMFAATAVAFAPLLARSLAWSRLLAASALGALGWSLALALTAGEGGLFDPLASPFEYLAGVPFITSPGDYLAGFTERIDAYPVHVRSHPPGFVLGLWGLEQIGLGGPRPASIVVVVVAASAVPAALVAARAVAGEDVARRAAPFLVLAPAAVWIATSADAFFMGIGAWAVATTVLALTSRGRRSHLLAVAGGVLFGLCALLSYGLALLALMPLTIAVMRRRVLPLAVAGFVAAAVILLPLAAGFWWLDGYFAIREEYLASVARDRPYDYFLVANLAAFAIATGPALAVALTRVRLTAAWALPLAGLAMVALADLSGMSKAEVERIWLPFVPWVLLATASLSPTRRGVVPVLLAAQTAVAIAVQTGIDTPW